MSNNIITEKDIEEKLAEKFHGNCKNLIERKLHRSINKDCYEDVGSILYSLDGSPPKGYALVIPEIRLVNFYDTKGKQFDSLYCTEVLELQDL